jgi:hypothetical protein
MLWRLGPPKRGAKAGDYFEKSAVTGPWITNNAF